MARQRFIWPDIWTDPTFGRLSPAEMLFFVGAFSNADDEGRLLGDAAYLRSAIFPYQQFTIDEVREIRDAVVKAHKKLSLYEVDGIEYLAFLSWRDYQTPKYPKPSKLPLPPVKARRRAGIAPGTEVVVQGRRWVKRKYIRKSLRESLLREAEHRCPKCDSTENLEIEHVIPISKGGSNERENLMVLCKSCNSRKRDQEGIPANREDEAFHDPENDFSKTEKRFSKTGPRVGLGRDGLKDKDVKSGQVESVARPEERLDDDSTENTSQKDKTEINLDRYWQEREREARRGADSLQPIGRSVPAELQRLKKGRAS